MPYSYAGRVRLVCKHRPSRDSKAASAIFQHDVSLTNICNEKMLLWPMSHSIRHYYCHCSHYYYYYCFQFLDCITVLRMWHIVTDGVAWSVCRSVCHSSEPCKNGWTNRDAFWVVDSGGPKEPCIRWGSSSPGGKWQFWGKKGRPILKYREYHPCVAVMRRFIKLLAPFVV